MLNRTVWLLWLQGWEHAPWLVQRVAESWELNNPGWNIQYLDEHNVRDFVSDAPYLFDEDRDIRPAHKSDIIRISLLKNYGGVWADATALCMQPLDTWVHDAVRPAGLWMYHGHGAGMSAMNGPAIWLIVSERGGLMIDKWKAECDTYWQSRTSADEYFWLDRRFRELHESDAEFRSQWRLAPHLYCNDRGQAHTLAGTRMTASDDRWKALIRDRPPYVLKMWWSPWEQAFADPLSEAARDSNGGYAIQLSTEGHVYDHQMSHEDTLALRARMFIADRRHDVRDTLATSRSSVGRWLQHRIPRLHRLLRAGRPR